MYHPSPDEVQRMKKLAYKIAVKRHLLAGVDKDTLAEDMMQEGWLGWISTADKPTTLRFRAAVGMMSNYWRRWRWGVHYKNGVDHDGHIINGERTRMIQRPMMEHVDVGKVSGKLGCSGNAEENLFVKEVLDHIQNTFGGKKNSDRFSKTLFDCLLDDGVRGVGNEKFASPSAKNRCIQEIRSVVKSLLEEQ